MEPDILLNFKAQETHRLVLCTCKATRRLPHWNSTQGFTVEDKNTKYIKGENKIPPCVCCTLSGNIQSGGHSITLVKLPAKHVKSESNHEKTSDKSNLRIILKNNWPIIFSGQNHESQGKTEKLLWIERG